MWDWEFQQLGSQVRSSSQCTLPPSPWSPAAQTCPDQSSCWHSVIMRTSWRRSTGWPQWDRASPPHSPGAISHGLSGDHSPAREASNPLCSPQQALWECLWSERVCTGRCGAGMPPSYLQRQFPSLRPCLAIWAWKHSSGWAKAHRLFPALGDIQQLWAAWDEESSVSCLELTRDGSANLTRLKFGLYQSLWDQSTEMGTCHLNILHGLVSEKS